LDHIRFEVRDPSGRIPPPAADLEPLDPFVSWLFERAGLPAGAYRAAPMHRRLAACLRALEVSSVSEARRRLTQHPELVATAVSSLLIGVTEFFRDADVFDAIGRIIADDLGMRPGPIRVWSAACSNGAELCSMAILLAEAGLLERSILVGTDCRADAIREAEAGLYSQASAEPAGALLRQKYLAKDCGCWRVTEPLGRRIQWRIRDLLSGAEDGPWDIILWRNAAIYLKLSPALAVWEALAQALRPGGLLVVGKAERPPASLGLRCVSRGIYGLPPQPN
jgi:chemotaxis methyl-accepting protein methylase